MFYEQCRHQEYHWTYTNEERNNNTPSSSSSMQNNTFKTSPSFGLALGRVAFDLQKQRTTG